MRIHKITSKIGGEKQQKSRPNLRPEKRVKRQKKAEQFLARPVRLIGLEPTRRKTPDPKSGASTNFATGADAFHKVVQI